MPMIEAFAEKLSWGASIMFVISAGISVLRKKAPVVLCFVLGQWASVFAQEPLPKPKPKTSITPPVPLLEPRPIEGEAANQRFQTVREGPD